MSTDILEIVGKKEDVFSNQLEYSDKKVSFTSFYGGSKRGKSLQINLDGDWVQISNKQVKELLVALNEEFES